MASASPTPLDLTNSAASSAQQTRPQVSRTPTLSPSTGPTPPITTPPASRLEELFPGPDKDTRKAQADLDAEKMLLELTDGSAFEGYSFGANKSISGECVFQTGMVGYPESLTDPSYAGQILVLTYPLIGSYGVPARPTPKSSTDLPDNFESYKIHVAGLVVGNYSGAGNDFSNHLAESELGKWLQEQGVPAVYGVDTRDLTKKLRERGSTVGRISKRVASASNASASWREAYDKVQFHDPNVTNLVAEVSRKDALVFKPTGNAAPLLHPSGRPVRVLCVDVGMKFNQIRCFTKRGVEVKVVPWDYNYLLPTEEPFDGLFVSNGPGDPATMTKTVETLSKALELAQFPIFGICLGHQLLGRASGAQTLKLKYGNRGANIPCTSLVSGRCYITSQNHGYAVDTATLKTGWQELFVNANDGSNEGIYSTEHPFFSVQFHPESRPGPRDTEFLFDVFLGAIEKSLKNPVAKGSKLSGPVEMPGGAAADNAKLHPRANVRKVLVLGSGGLSIGQAGEFDYSGSQAIKALKEEGIYTVLINPNIATIQTSKGLADKVYFLPVTAEFVRKVIQHERPDGIYCTFGGQTALSVGIKLKDEFEGLGVKVLGTPIETIITTEDRELFANAMEEIGEKCAKSASATNIEECVAAANDIGYPVIVRAAFALGGLGSGFAYNEQELVELCTKAFATSSQVLVEKSMKGWKEIEYEVVRDCRDNCITVCNMENFDPLGIHTGDSIVVAPSQTLSDSDYNMLRTTAVNVIRHLGVVGECNIQYALNPHSQEYCIIEVNARLSRSSALASKATGYPLAFIAAKLGLNIPLNEIKNSVTKLTSACFEPSLDYIVVKIPRWDLKKFTRVSTTLSSSMKSVGEVMAIGRTFEETMQKAIRAIDPSFAGFGKNDYNDDIDEELKNPSDKRVFAIGNAMAAGRSVDEIHELTKIDKWFLRKLEHISQLEKIISRYSTAQIPAALIKTAKQMGFSDNQLAKLLGSNELAVRRLRIENGITPRVKQIDTVAAEFPAFTNYLYTTYNGGEHDVKFDDKGIMVLGSGVYRIGSSVEFDWCAVRAIRTIRDRGFKTVMVNYNPETVSTDYDEADRLYFEVISLETVLDIYEAESSSGVVVSMGGQTSNNIALPLYRQGVNVLGTSPENIDMAENRYKFSRMCDKIGVDQPLWKELSTMDAAHEFCDKVGYPVLVRPSYVLSGAAMNVVYSSDDLDAYLTQAANVSREHPVVVTKYIEEAKEIEMDAVARDGKLVMHYVSEHVENAGVHSGDATLILPPQDLDPETVRRIEAATAKIGAALNVTGPFNIQFIAKNNEIKVIECNVRAARSFPFVSKVTGVDAIELATDIMLGLPVESYPALNLPPDYVGIKVPQFSFGRLAGADPILGVEMASTGEVACFGKDKYEAYLKALLSTGMSMPKKNVLFSIGSYKEKLEMLPSVQKLHALGYNIFATAGTSDFLQEHGVPVKYLEALEDAEERNSQKSEYSLNQHIANNLIDLYINLPSKNRYRRPASYMSKGYRSRRMAVDFAIPLVTNVKCAKLFIEALARQPTLNIASVDYKTSHRTVVLPGFVNTRAFVPNIAIANSKADVASATQASISGGFTSIQIMPLGVTANIEDGLTLDVAKENASSSAHCDYTLGVAATSENASRITPALVTAARTLSLPFTNLAGLASKVTAIAAHFAAWPINKPIVTDARTTDLASVLLLASLHGRSIHITNVQTQEDIGLIALSKEKDLKVTCDVSIYSLFLTREEFGAKCLPTAQDQAALWSNLDVIDIFSVGSLPYRLATELGHTYAAGAGSEEAIRLLLSAVNDGRLSLDDLTLRLSDNPRAIFDLPVQPNTYFEVEVDRKTISPKGAIWSPLEGRSIAGAVHRVVLRGNTVFLDGTFFPSRPAGGKDISESAAVVKAERKQARFSISSTRPSLQSLGFPSKPFDSSASPVSPVIGSGALATRSPKLGASRSPRLDAVDAPLQPSLMSLATPSPASQLATNPLASLSNLVQNASYHRRHILSVRAFNRDDLHSLFGVASEMRMLVERHIPIDILRGRVMCTMFFEPSTRTSSSFQAAMNRLGGSVVATTPETSSVTKGESLADTVRTLGCYGDVIVLRHPAKGSAQEAAKFSPVPIINAGDGIGEHPTQALLDIYTIREELGTVNGLTITMVGDLKNGRTVHSLVKLLSLYSVQLNFVSPASLSMPESVKAEATKAGISFIETSSLASVIGSTDVLYVTRVQQERFTSVAEYEAVKNEYIVNNELLARAKSHCIVMHPLPRNAELDPEVDFDQRRAAYFRQMRFGLFIRMALLALVLGGNQ
ncbi:putative bifunctional pyrimidine biosynthesis protein PyrABCN [Meredithblackwellia eburnea MCA 4105]